MNVHRRQFLSAASLGIAITAKSVLADEVADVLPTDLATRQGADWPTLLGAKGDSIAVGPVPGPWPETGPKIIYTLDMGEGYAMPSVSRGRLLAFDRVGDKIRLRCIHAETSKALWDFSYPTAYEDKYGYDGGPRTSPVIDGSRVYIIGPEGMLHALDVATGKVLWKRDTTAEFGVVQNFFGVGSTPIVSGDLLLVQVGGSPSGSDTTDIANLKSTGTALVAFNKRTGTLAWKAGDDLASYSSPVLATLAQQPVCLLLARSGLWAFDLPSGKPKLLLPWRSATLESVNAANPVPLDADQILISETYGPGAALVRATPTASEIVWSDRDKRQGKSLQTHWCTPVRMGDVVFASSGRHEGNAELRCVRWRDGKVLWSEPGLGRASILRVGETLVVQAERGEVLLVSARQDRFAVISAHRLVDALGRPLLRYPCWAAPIMARGLLYLRGAGKMVCLEAKS
jgi:outer membrane protein assembly factor BamB